MKPLVCICIAILFIFSSCKKSGSGISYMNTATIISMNWSQPVCGSTYTIIIHGIPDSNAQSSELPTGSTSLALSTFPVNVKLNWHHTTVYGCDISINNIIIDAIDKVN